MSHRLWRLDLPGAQEISLDRRMVSLGSDGRNTVRVEAEGVLPSHAYLVFQMGAWQLRALDRDHPVSVNGKVCDGQIVLRSGDEFSIGTARFRLTEGDEEPAVHLAGAALEGTHRDGRSGDAQLAVDLFTRMVGENDRERLLPMLLREVAVRLGGDGAQLIFARGEEAPRTQVTWPDGAARDRFSGSALREAERRDGTVLFSQSDLQELPTQESILLNDIRSVLCGPLPFENGGSGFLYLDRLAGHPGFTEEDRAEFEDWRTFFAELLARTLREESQSRAIAHLQKTQAELLPSLGAVFECEAMKKTFLEASRVAAAQVPVLIQGETGTGKEVLARFVHRSSPRCDGPFVAVNCGAIPENLVESEFFGHEKGAFTGADAQRIGLVESADGGTLFLDELGELPLGMQVKLLRVLQQGELVRVGGTVPVPVNFRLVSATNRDLQQEVEAGRFRSDLFFRVNVIQVKLPPLRERDRDAVLLARHYLKLYAAQYGTGPKELGRSAEKSILASRWPGNVRELENRVQKAVLLSSGERISPEDLGLAADAPGASLPSAAADEDGGTLYEVRERAEKRCIEKALQKAEGNVSLTSRILDVDRKVLIRMIERLGLRPESYRHRG